VDYSTPVCSDLIDRLVDGIAVNGLSITHRAQLSRVDPGLGCPARLCQFVSIRRCECHAVVKERGGKRKADSGGAPQKTPSRSEQHRKRVCCQQTNALSWPRFKACANWSLPLADNLSDHLAKGKPDLPRR